MRVCVIHSSYEGSNSVFTEHESDGDVPNPGYYVDPEHHIFEVRFVRKQTAKKDIDRMVAEKFDLYWHFMWGQHYDDVAGIEAVQYLETQPIILLGSPSDYMEMNKLDLHLAAKATNDFHVPANEPGRYPKMVKFADGMASVGMDTNSVCRSPEEVDAKVTELRRVDPKRRILIEDFIRGIETTAVVVEMGSEVVALPPFDFVFPEETPADEAWLSYKAKFDDLDKGLIRFRFVNDPKRAADTCQAAVAAYKALGLQGRGAWGRMDARVEVETGRVYCLEMNHYPALFHPPGNNISDDLLLRQWYPGGHEAFVDMMIYTKLRQVKLQQKHPAKSHTPRDKVVSNGYHERESANGHANGCNNSDVKQSMNGSSNGQEQRSKPVGDLKASGTTIADVYDSCVNTYDDVQAKMAIREWQIKYFQQYEYQGTVLDLACGTGGIGMLIQEAGNKAMIHGIDVSSLSLKTPQVQKYYASTSVGLIQDAVMSAGTFDHVTCFGALHFLSRVEFNAAISRMFMLARRSVAFDVDDISTQYNELILSHFGEGLRNHNNILAYKRFGTPPGWRKVVEEERSLFYSPSVKIDVPGIVVRFERIAD